MKLLRRKSAPSLDERLAALLEAASLGEGRLSVAAVSGALSVAGRAGVRRSLSVDHTVAALAGATGSGKSSLFNELAGTSLATVGVTRPTTSVAQAALWEGSGSGPLLDWLSVPARHEVDDPASANEPDFSGLVLLDLPDHDSIELAHRLEVDRLVELVDLLVWVVDPQKYADAALHERYLQPLAAHRDVMVVVLNQVDRLSSAAAERCLADLRRLLEDDGLAGVPVVGVSTRTGAGIADLRSMLTERVADRRSWAARLAADITTAAHILATAPPAVLSPTPDPTPAQPAIDPPAAGSPTQAQPAIDPPADPPTAGSPTLALPGAGAAGGRAAVSGATRTAGGGGSGALGLESTSALPGAGMAAARAMVSSAMVSGARRAEGVAATRTDGLVKPLTAALVEAAGVPLVVEAVGKAHRHRAVVATGWPVTRWLRRFRPDPLRRLRLGVGSGGALGSGLGSGSGGGESGRELVGKTSIPGASAVQRSRVDTAIRDVGEAAARELPEPWAVAVRRAARARAGGLADGLDRAVAVTSLDVTRRPVWWRVIGLLQWLVFAAMVAGALWLGGLFLMDYLRLPELPTPSVGLTLGEVPWPTLLLVGGVLAGVLIALLSRVMAWLGGRRRARKAARALRESITEVGREYVLGPVEEELARYTRFVEVVAVAQGERR